MIKFSELPEVAKFRMKMKRRHQPAFSLCERCHQIMEEAVTRRRDLSNPFACALDLLFVQAFKSHGSVYLLCVHGQGEDAATIARRVLEIRFQVSYLCAVEDERKDRGRSYLAWFWKQADSRIGAGIPIADAKRWQAGYDADKHSLIGTNRKPHQYWWGDFSIKKLARKAGLESRYERDYHFLSQASHCTSAGLMLGWHDRNPEIRTTGREIPTLLVHSTAYLLEIAHLWNEFFGLIDTEHIQDSAKRVIEFYQKSEIK